jgi:hypothetical protein
MDSLVKPVAIILAGIGQLIVGCVEHESGPARFDALRTSVDSDCRAFRDQPRNHNAGICRPYDRFAPKASRRFAEAEPWLEEARAKLAEGDRAGGEERLRRVLGVVDELELQGTVLADAVAGALVSRTLDILEQHQELDARAVLRDVELDAHPFTKLRLHRKWMIAHADELPPPRITRSATESVRAIEETESSLLAMAEHLRRRDVAACTAAETMPDENEQGICEHVDRIAMTAARLDAARAPRARPRAF